MAKKPGLTREFTNAGVSNSRQMMTSLDANDYRTQERSASGGKKLLLRTKGGMPQITGSGKPPELYMDNGFIRQGGYGPAVDADTAEPINLDKNSTTDARYLVVEKKIADEDKIYLEPQEYSNYWRSFTTKKNKDAVPGTLPNRLDLLKVKNYALLVCPPSCFSGLARRYVAAIYGKDLDDVALNEMSGSQWSLNYNQVPLSAAATGIFYSAVHNRYWLLFLSSSSLTYVSMYQEDAGEALLDDLLDPALTAEEKKQVHSYVLADSFAQRNPDDAVWYRDGGSFVTEGGPLSFGWRFNSDGSKATMTTLDKPNLTFNNSHRYEATITLSDNLEVPEGHPLRLKLSVAVVKVEEVLLWTSSRVRVFYPISAGQYLWLRTGYTDGEASNVPLISFYDDNDGLQVCRFTFTPGVTEAHRDGEYTGSVLTAEGTYPTFLENATGWGGGYAFWDALREVGDGASLSLGGYSATDVKLTDHNIISYSTTVGAEVLIGGMGVLAANPISFGYGALGVNGAENTNFAATYGYSGRINIYLSPYTWEASGNYFGTNSKASSFLMVAPGDCSTAWLEAIHTGETQATVLDAITPDFHSGAQHTFRWVSAHLIAEGPLAGTYAEDGNAAGTAQDGLINMGPKMVASDDRASGSNNSAVQNAKGRFVISGNSEEGATGPFWAATVGSPLVTFDMNVQDDLKSACRASSIIGGADYTADWPSNTFRSIGWQ